MLFFFVINQEVLVALSGKEFLTVSDFSAGQELGGVEMMCCFLPH